MSIKQQMQTIRVLVGEALCRERGLEVDPSFAPAISEAQQHFSRMSPQDVLTAVVHLNMSGLKIYNCRVRSSASTTRDNITRY